MRHNLFKSHTLAVGLAMFSMFFGAGNIIFPLAMGQSAQDKTFFAVLGLILTAAVMPIVGLIAMLLYKGNIRHFFGRVGKTPGFLLALSIIALLGPLGSTPRCIALSFATFQSCFSSLSPIVFSAVSCLVIFLFAFRKSQLLNLLGWVLTPLLLLSLTAIIIMGFLQPHSMDAYEGSNLHVFFEGLKEGYNTMDLLAAFFFSSSILTALRTANWTEENGIKTALRASLVGLFLLISVYIGFSYLAAYHGQNLGIQSKEQLLAAITLKIAGPYAGMLVCITISLACLTTAIALISAFTDFMHTEVFKGKIRYSILLAGGIVFTFLVSITEFTAISAFLSPILQICYPGLIVLTILNIAHRLKGFNSIRVPVFGAFSLSTLMYLFQN